MDQGRDGGQSSREPYFPLPHSTLDFFLHNSSVGKLGIDSSPDLAVVTWKWFLAPFVCGASCLPPPPLRAEFYTADPEFSREVVGATSPESQARNVPLAEPYMHKRNFCLKTAKTWSPRAKARQCKLDRQRDKRQHESVDLARADGC